MNILTIAEQNREFQWLCFETLEEGREFTKLLPGYHYVLNDKDGSIEEEWLLPLEIPDYTEIEFHGNIIPLSKFMFHDFEKATIYYREVPSLSTSNHGMIEGYTIIDAYAIPNTDVRAYVEKREKMFLTVKNILEEKGFEVERAYHGSEDGEAILYRRSTDSRWFFLDHMDPLFVDLAKESDVQIREWVEQSLL